MVGHCAAEPLGVAPRRDFCANHLQATDPTAKGLPTVLQVVLFCSGRVLHGMRHTRIHIHQSAGWHCQTAPPMPLLAPATAERGRIGDARRGNRPGTRLSLRVLKRTRSGEPCTSGRFADGRRLLPFGSNAPIGLKESYGGSAEGLSRPSGDCSWRIICASIPIEAGDPLARRLLGLRMLADRAYPRPSGRSTIPQRLPSYGPGIYPTALPRSTAVWLKAASVLTGERWPCAGARLHAFCPGCRIEWAPGVCGDSDMETLRRKPRRGLVLGLELLRASCADSCLL